MLTLMLPQNIPLLPSLLQTSVLALLSASLPLSKTLTSVLLAVSSDAASNALIRNPTPAQLQGAKSVHVLAFTSHGELILTESEGCFTMKEWESVYDTGKRLCCDESSEDDDMRGQLEENPGSMDMFVKSILKEKVANDLHWK